MFEACGHSLAGAPRDCPRERSFEIGSAARVVGTLCAHRVSANHGGNPLSSLFMNKLFVIWPRVLLFPQQNQTVFASLISGWGASQRKTRPLVKNSAVSGRRSRPLLGIWFLGRTHGRTRVRTDGRTSAWVDGRNALPEVITPCKKE